MSARDKQNLRTGGFDWLGIARIVILQVLILLGLTSAAVRYVSWSSNAAWREFSGASKPAALEAKTPPRSPTRGEAVKRPDACPRSA
jgi:hypothetical protein